MRKLFLALLTLMLCAVSACTASTPQESTIQESTEISAESGTETAAEAAPEAASLDLAADIDVQTVASILDHPDIFLLDVREQSEYDAGHIAGNTLIPTGSIADRLAEIPKDKEVVIYCHSGARSSRVFDFLTQQGYTNIHNMQGGIVAWQSAGFEVEK